MHTYTDQDYHVYTIKNAQNTVNLLLCSEKRKNNVLISVQFTTLSIPH